VKFDVVQFEVNARNLGGGVAELVVRAVGNDESLDGVAVVSQFAADDSARAGTRIPKRVREAYAFTGAVRVDA
jgi:hypothetical protein